MVNTITEHDIKHYRNTLSNWAAGVTVVTSCYENIKHGMTVNAFNSVSLNPLLILICINQETHIHHLIKKSGYFAVNLLGSNQVEWGKLFAGFYPEIENRFEGVKYRTESTGAPILPNVLAWLDCELEQAVPGGDHTIFLGRVLSFDYDDTLSPLIYTQRSWGHFTPAPDPPA